MKHVVIGIAGCAGSGKTMLARLLVGDEPLPEPPERGFGSAAHRLPDGTVAGVVDLPGRQELFDQMLAGAAGIDVALLTIAATDDVTPQTIEHLDVLHLLGVRHLVVALTKCDLADRERMEAVEQEIRAQLTATSFKNAPAVRVCAATRRGLGSLRRALMAAASRVEPRNSELPFRLLVDSVPALYSNAIEVTGALVAGTLSVGDVVEIVPQRRVAHVRGLKIYGKASEMAEAGCRVTVSLLGEDLDEIRPDAQLAVRGALAPTRRLDVEIRLPAQQDVDDGACVHIHLGTARTTGRLVLPAADAGEMRFAQLLLDSDLAAARGDRFVVRAGSPARLLGGGIVLDASPIQAAEAALAAGPAGPADLLEAALLCAPAGLARARADAEGLPELVARGTAVLLPGGRVLHATHLQRLTDRAELALESYHIRFPQRPGMPQERLRLAADPYGIGLPPDAFRALLSLWESQGRILTESATVWKTGYQAMLNERQKWLSGRIRAVYEGYGICAPTVAQVSARVGAPPDAVEALIRSGLENGTFKRVDEGVYYSADTLSAVADQLASYLDANDGITVAQYRDMTRIGRRLALMLLEHFDRIGLTQRDGDLRRLAMQPDPD
jgi:selenocysteine-specific elongation factor